MKNPFVIYPSLQMAGNAWSRGTLIDHHIGIISQCPQGVYPVQILFMGAAVIGQDIDTAVSVALYGSKFTKATEILRQVLVRLSHAKCTAFVRTLFSRDTLSRLIRRISSPWVKSTSARLSISCSMSLSWSGQASRFGSISLISSSPFQNSERSATRTLLRPSFLLTIQNPQFLGQPRLKKP